MMADFYRWRIYKWGEVARDSVGRLVEAGEGRDPDVKWEEGPGRRSEFTRQVG
jgi:hypothetical protein